MIIMWRTWCAWFVVVAWSTVSWLMKVLLPTLIAFLLCLYHLDAFVPASTLRRVDGSSRHLNQGSAGNRWLRIQHNQAANSNGNDPSLSRGVNDAKEAILPKPFEHRDLIWKLRPPPEYPWWRRFLLRLACNALRLEAVLRGRTLPTVLSPRGGKAQLECYHGRTRLGRFGVTTESGPPIPPLQETVADLYGRDPAILVSAAAVIYMYVEPEFRRRNVGALALEVISLIHACHNVDFTVLVANDKGSGKLLEWYERHGYQRAPKLQDVFGSPSGVYGVAMVSPTRKHLPDGCRIQWW